MTKVYFHSTMKQGCPKPIKSMYKIFTEKAMAPHSSTHAWKIPWTEGPGWLQSMGSLGVGHD